MRTSDNFIHGSIPSFGNFSLPAEIVTYSRSRNLLFTGRCIVFLADNESESAI
jgi:hypothetical protein